MSVFNNMPIDVTIDKDGADIFFYFSFKDDRDEYISEYEKEVARIKDIFKKEYANFASEYIKDYQDDNIKSMAIEHTKVFAIIKYLSSLGCKLTVNGLNNNKEYDTVVVDRYDHCENAKKVIPYYNKNNNDLTNHRYK